MVRRRRFNESYQWVGLCGTCAEGIGGVFYRNSYLDSLNQLQIRQMVMMLVIRERHDDGMITSLMSRLMMFVMAIIIRCPDSEPPLGHAIAIWIHQTNSWNGWWPEIILGKRYIPWGHRDNDDMAMTMMATTLLEWHWQPVSQSGVDSFYLLSPFLHQLFWMLCKSGIPEKQNDIK